MVTQRTFFFSQYSDIFKEPFLLRVKYSNAYFYIAQNASDHHHNSGKFSSPVFVCWLISLHLFERACILTETCERALKSGGNRRGRRFCDTTERFFWDRAAYLHFCQLSFQFQCAAQCKYNQHVAAMSLRFHNDEKQFNHENKYFSSGFLNGISVGLEV